jgi:signal transduction histidine kinase
MSAIPTSLRADGVGRYRPDVESTVYFACVEAVQNAEKHAAGASYVAISLAADGPLTFSVSDDGAGFDTARRQSGSFASLHDRLDAIGGSIEVRSAPGSGTCVSGIVPEPTPVVWAASRPPVASTSTSTDVLQLTVSPDTSDA